MITILMPVYNGLEFLDEAIDSIKAQTYPSWELLIGINGYAKESAAFVKATRHESQKIKVLDIYWTQGKSAALNAMMHHVGTDWVALLDVDDLWEPTKLMRQVHYLDTFDVVGTQCRYFGDKTDSPNIPLGEVPPNSFWWDNPIINSSAILRSDDAIWDEGFNTGLEDYELWARLNFRHRRFFNVPAPLVRHRIHQASYFNTRRHDVALAEIHRRYHG